ncbi:hypothetical protein BPO_0811 [Bergeyella porcorum]|uniref:Cyclic lactone autoinducer peptide n=1 Tax=Bergeyella porcorum TaxID=1735111 RepID=A0AAU0F0K1_9FLAO
MSYILGAFLRSSSQTFPNLPKKCDFWEGFRKETARKPEEK